MNCAVTSVSWVTLDRRALDECLAAGGKWKLSEIAELRIVGTISAIRRSLPVAKHYILWHQAPVRPCMNALDQLWRTHPSDREQLRPYVEKARAYRNECGCSMGAAFFSASILILIIRSAVFHFAVNGRWFMAIVQAIGMMLGAAILGKLLGIGVARIRLLLLYRDLQNRYRVQGG